MKQLLILIFFCFITAQSGFAMPSIRPVHIPPMPPEIDLSTVAKSNEEGKTKITIISLEGFSASQDTRFRRIVKNTEAVINSIAFRTLIEGWYFEGKNQFHMTSDSPKAVYRKIMGSNWELDYRLEWIWKTSVIGYTRPEVRWIVFNSRKFDSLPDDMIAQNICHEFGGHKLGRYNHEFEPTPERLFSVPYGAGWSCGEIYRELFK